MAGKLENLIDTLKHEPVHTAKSTVPERRNIHTLRNLAPFFAEIDKLDALIEEAIELNDEKNGDRMIAIGAKLGEIADAATRHRVTVLHSEEMTSG